MRKLIVLTLVTAITAVTGVTVALAGNGPRPPADVQLGRRPIVRIMAVHPGTGCVGLDLRIRGWKMIPGSVGNPVNVRGGGHYHIYVNGKYYAYGSNAHQAKVCGLDGGETYRFQVILAWNNHQELSARSQVVTAVVR